MIALPHLWQHFAGAGRREGSLVKVGVAVLMAEDSSMAS